MKNTYEVEEAIRLLYEQYGNDIYRYARLTLGDPSAAKDVVQEVFLRAFRSWASFRQEATAGTWLMSIARNHIYDLLRKKRVERKFLTDSRPETILDTSPPVETTMILQEALSMLKDTYRQVFILRHVQHYSVVETAQILGWSQSNVKTTDQRAIAKLRDILGIRPREVNDK